MTDESPDEIDISPQGSDSATDLVLAALATLNQTMESVRETLERREKQSPGQFKLSAIPRSTSLRFRVTTLVVTVTAAGAYGLQIGTAVEFTIQASGPFTFVIPYPITIDSGKEISISGTAANISDAFIEGFTDEEPQ